MISNVVLRLLKKKLLWIKLLKKDTELAMTIFFRLYVKHLYA